MSQPQPVIPILSAANFVIGMGAFMAIGFLDPLADDLGITAAKAGWLIIAYALGYAVSSPLLVSLTGGMGRRRVLTFGLVLFSAACLACAAAPTAPVLIAARVVAAMGAGMITPVAANVAAGLVPPERQARALAGVFFGFTLSQVMGVPVGGWIGYTFGWRTAFALVGLLTLPVAALVWLRVPAGLAFVPVSLPALGALLASWRHLLMISFTAVFVSSAYVIFTFISPLLTETMAFGRDAMTAFLLVSGLGAVIGNLLGGQVADRIGGTRTLGLLCLAQVAVLPWFSHLPLPMATVWALGFAWAVFGWSFTAVQQARLIAFDAPRAPVLIALNASAIYAGTALGGWIGGLALQFGGLSTLGYAGASVVLCALALLVLSTRIAAPAPA